MFQWLFDLPDTSPIAYAIGLVALVCAAGMAVGSIKHKGIGLGSAGVLFVGMLAARFSEPVEPHMLAFLREFGLVLFVFTIGLQLGPGFFASLKREGLKLNVLGAVLVLMASGLAPLVSWLFGVDLNSVAGLFAGASTNTPALGAAQQTLAAVPGMSTEQLALPAVACAVAYPAAIAGLLGTLVAMKVIFRIDPIKEAERNAAERLSSIEPLLRRTLIIEGSRLTGLTLHQVYERLGEGIIVSRIRSAGELEAQTALPATQLRQGDTILAVGTRRRLDEFERLVGRQSNEDLMAMPGKVAYRRNAVTNKRVLGRSFAELALESTLGVEVTRIARGDVEMTAAASLRLQFGDVVQVVGPPEQLEKAAALLGNSLKALNETQFVPLFAGICLGIIVGSIPLAVPGLSQPLRLGLAGGPLVIALELGRIGHIGGLVWHMPLVANHAFREFGVALFFAALGLAAGDQFFAAVISPRGLLWLVTGAIITLAPLVAVSLWALLVEKMNFVTLGGLLAGGMTNPPALTFVSNLCRSEAPALAYATVYPLTTLLRIFVAQVLALALSS